MTPPPNSWAKYVKKSLIYSVEQMIEYLKSAVLASGGRNDELKVAVQKADDCGKE